MEHSFTSQLWAYFPKDGNTASYRIPYFNYIRRKIAKIGNWTETSQHNVSMQGDMVQIDFKRKDGDTKKMREYVLLKGWT